MTPWCPANRLEWEQEIILSAHISGIANNAASFSGVETILNSKEFSNIYFSANASNFWIAVLVLGNLFWAIYRQIALKKSWLSILPVFPLSQQANVYLWVPFLYYF